MNMLASTFRRTPTVPTPALPAPSPFRRLTNQQDQAQPLPSDWPEIPEEHPQPLPLENLEPAQQDAVMKVGKKKSSPHMYVDDAEKKGTRRPTKGGEEKEQRNMIK